MFTKAMISIKYRLNDSHGRMYSNWDILCLFVPLLLERLLNQVLGLADTMMVSSVNDIAVSAMGLYNKAMTPVSVIATGIVSSASIYATQLYGKRDYDLALKYIKNMILLHYAFSLPVFLLKTVFGEYFFGLMYPGISRDVLDLLKHISWVYAPGFLIGGLSSAFGTIFVCQGNMRITVSTNLIVGTLNVFGNFLFINVFHWGVTGACVSTMICTYIRFFIYLYKVRQKDMPIHFEFKSWKSFLPRKDRTKNLLKMSFANSLGSFLYSYAKVLLATLVIACGTVALNADTVAHELAGLYVLAGNVVGELIRIIIGHCKGAGKLDDTLYFAKKLLKISMLCQTVFALILTLLINFFMATYHLSPEAATLSKQLTLPYFFLGIVFWTLAYAPEHIFNACGDIKYTVTVTSVCTWVLRVGFSFIMFYFTPLGIWSVWVSSYMEWIAKTICNLIHFKRRKWLKKEIL